MAYEKTIWSAGTRIKPAHVTIGGEEYEVTPETREGGTPFSVSNMQKLEDGVAAANKVTTIISPTEPTTGEEVWIKKSDNHLDTRAFVNETKNGLTLTYDNGLFTITGKATASTSFLINYILSNLVIGETYTLSAIGDTTGITNFGFKSAGGGDRFIVDNGVSKTVEMTQYIISEVGRFDFYIGSGQTVNANFYVQLTQGEEIPEIYKPYADKEIYVKNDNGVYEEFTPKIEQNIVTGVEYKTGRIIDGKVEYAKRISCGALPNNTTKYIETGLTNVSITKPVTGFFTDVSQYSVFPLPFVSSYIAGNVGVYATSTNTKVTIKTGEDKTAYTVSYVDLYYTKN